MKRYPFFIFSFVFISISGILAVAQTEKDYDKSLYKVAVINSRTFRNKDTGIKEVIDAYDRLEADLKPQLEELRLMAEEIKKRENALKVLSGNSHPQIEEINARIKRYELAVNNFKGKQEKIKSFHEKRAFELTADINKRISEVANLFTKENGYLFILDISKLDESFILTKSDNADVTKEFVKYYKESVAKAKMR